MCPDSYINYLGFVFQFYLQDTKSSNGTFVNSQRLSKGSEESVPHELYSGDIVQFGVDVMENSRRGKTLPLPHDSLSQGPHVLSGLHASATARVISRRWLGCSPNQYTVYMCRVQNLRGKCNLYSNSPIQGVRYFNVITLLVTQGYSTRVCIAQR